MNYRLGIDLGTNSLGWAVLKLNGDNEACEIQDCGVRIFSNGRHPKTKVSNAVQRRTARLMRRNRDRKQRRQFNLLKYFDRIGLFPKDLQQRESLKLLDPLSLRCKALDEKISPYELGRAIQHLQKRRGFKSNRKGAKETQDTKFKSSLRELENKIQGTGSRTFAEYLYKHIGQIKRAKSYSGFDLHPTRKLIEDEFYAILNAQKLHHDFITDEVVGKIHHIVFHQRRLKSQEELVGQCELYADKRRAPLFSPFFQLFRILQQVSDLKIEKSGKILDLDFSQKGKLVEVLTKKSKVGFDAIRKSLGLGTECRFNLEDERRKDLKGDSQTYELVKHIKESDIGPSWRDLNSYHKVHGVIAIIVDLEEDKELTERLMQYGLKEEDVQRCVEKLSDTSFASGYGSFSLEALKDLCKTMIDYGFCRVDQALEILRSDIIEENKQYDRLPRYGEYLRKDTVPRFTERDKAREDRRVTNPTVHVGLIQLEKVVNRIIGKYGRPSEVIIELARELKLNKKQLDAVNKNQKENQKSNERIRAELQHKGIHDSYDNKLRLRLWEKNIPKIGGIHVCPYSGKPINIESLFDENLIQVEHILPYSRTLDDSFNNLTLTFTEVNRDKGNLSPFEKWGKESERYQQILERVSCLPFATRKRFNESAIEVYLNENTWVASQLNDTRYLSRLAHKYFQAILDKNKIFVTKGAFTAKIRHHFGLNTVLKELNQALDISNEKARDDHRHHAVDAIVIALCDPKYLWKVRQDVERRRLSELQINPPWEGFRDDVKAKISGVKADHKVDHSINDAFFGETAYGKTSVDDQYAVMNKYNLIERIDVTELNDKKSEAIVDPGLRNLGLNSPIETVKEKLILKGARKIRVYKTDSSAYEVHHPKGRKKFYKLYISEGINHLQVWEDPKGKQYFYGVSIYESNIYKGAKLDNYIKKKLATNLDQRGLHPSSKKIISLYKRDTVYANGKLWIVKSIKPSKGNELIELIDVNNQSAKPLYLRFNKFKDSDLKLAKII